MTVHSRNASKEGFRYGLLSILRGPRQGAPRVRTRRTVGSFYTDGMMRYDDADRFGRDVPKIETLVGSKR